MNIHEALDWRYAVREFSPEKLDGQTVDRRDDEPGNRQQEQGKKSD